MELRHLRYFIAVAEELNFRKAAKRLHMEQPPLSRQIRQLEEELKVELFQRNKREVSLTEAGQAFLGEARLTVAQAERATQVAMQFNEERQKRITIGYETCAFDLMVSKMIYAFRKNNPEVAIILKGMNTSAQTEALLRGEIDLGFAYLPINQSKVSSLSIRKKPLMVVLPQEHPLASLTTIPFSSLAEESFVIYPRVVKPDYYDFFITLCHQTGFQPKIIQEATPPFMILSLVAAGVGISVLGLSDEAQQYTGVVFRDIAQSQFYLDLGVISHKQRSTRMVTEFIEIVKQFSNVNI